MKLPAIKLAILPLLAALSGGPEPAVPVTRDVVLMGTSLRVSVTAPSRDSGFRAIETALGRMRAVDTILNDWRTDTELSRLNRSTPQVECRLSPALLQYIRPIVAWTERTQGAFDPAIGSLVDAWDFRGAGRRPSALQLEKARALTGLSRFAIDTMGGTIRRPFEGSWIDAGGFGKGAALQAAVEVLSRDLDGTGVLNFGGQIAVLGDTTIAIEVAHPASRFEPVARVRLHRASASTSAQSERYLEVEGERFGHVLDPRTGFPVPAWGSVTVVHSDPLIADILSTALFVMGPDEGLRWLERHPIAALFLIHRNGRLNARWSPAMRPLLLSLPTNPQGK